MNRSRRTTTDSSTLKCEETGSKPTQSKEFSVNSKTERQEKARWSRIKRVYGLSKDDYKKLDKGGCPICLRPWGGSVRPAVDHDHVDGWVRGIVCLYCNRTRIGRFRDSDLVRRIADYLDQQFEHKVPERKKKRKKRKVKP